MAGWSPSTPESTMATVTPSPFDPNHAGAAVSKGRRRVSSGNRSRRKGSLQAGSIPAGAFGGRSAVTAGRAG